MLNTMLKNILMLTSLSVALLPQVSMANTPIEKLVEPIALYPDALLAQILPASTNPIQIVEAARYLRTQGDDINLNPDTNWHPSVKALLPVPPVLEMMNTKLSWTVELGEAVKNDQKAVLKAIQKVRSIAYEAGELSSSDKQIVIVEKEVIKVVPANPQVIYVPQYYSYPPSTTVVYVDHSEEAAFVGFTVGLIIGAAIADDHYFDWHHHHFHYSDDVYGDIRRIQEDRQQFIRERHDEASREISERQSQRRDDISERQPDRRREEGEKRTERQTSRQKPSEARVGDRSQAAKQRDANRQQQYQDYRSYQNQTNREISRQRQESLSSRSGTNRSGSMFGGSQANSRSTRNSSQRGDGSRGMSGRSGGRQRR